MIGIIQIPHGGKNAEELLRLGIITTKRVLDFLPRGGRTVIPGSKPTIFVGIKLQSKELYQNGSSKNSLRFPHYINLPGNSPIKAELHTMSIILFP